MSATPGLKPSSVVVPLDGSPFSTTALPTGAAIAYAADAELHLLGIARSDGELDWVYNHTHAAVELVPAPVKASRVEVIVRPQPATVLLDGARDGTALLCFASHDRGPAAATVLHSVGTHVIQHAVRPFVVVGANPPDPTAGRDVVVALDGRGDAEPLLDVAGAWAGILDAPLRIVTVFEPAPADVRQASHYTRHHGPPGDPFDYLARWKDRVLPSTETDVAIAAIADPISPAAGLAEHLRAYPAFLLAVGRGHSVATELGGGVVRNLLRTVPVPLLVVPGVRPEVRAEAVALPGTTQEA